MIMKQIKNFLLPLVLLLLFGCSQSKQVLYSNNVCLFSGNEHISDSKVKIKIVFDGSIVTLTNLLNDSLTTVKRLNLKVAQGFQDGDSVLRWDATLDETPIQFAVLKSSNEIISVALVKDNVGFVFLIVPKEKVINKNSKNGTN